MRLVSLALLLGSALFAHSPPVAPDDPSKPAAEPAAQPPDPKAKVEVAPEKGDSLPEWFKEALQKVTVNVVAAKTCSIPLLNAMPKDAPPVDKAMILPAPSNPGRFTIRQVSPPAPPCDDVKR
jgi:hypothetical protein